MEAQKATAFIPEIWDASIYRTLEDNLIAKKICKDKSSMVKAQGDTIYFNDLADPTVNSYEGTVSYESLVAGQIALKVDTAKYYGFLVQDIEAAMANVDLKGSQAERAGYTLRKAVDTDLLGSKVYNEATGGTVTDATVDTTTILSDISQASRKLEEANVEPGNKFLVVAPWVKEKLILAGVKFQINNGTDGKGGIYFAQYLDLDIYVSNNVTNLRTVDAPQSICLAGSYDAIGYAEKLMTSEALKDKDKFGTYVRGMIVYGIKVLKPKELVKVDLTYAAETAI